MSNSDYFSLMPRKLRQDKGITPPAKVLFAEISALSTKEGYCWASNQYLSDLYGATDRTIRRWLNELIDGGYVYCEYEDGPLGHNSFRKIYRTETKNQSLGRTSDDLGRTSDDTWGDTDVRPGGTQMSGNSKRTIEESIRPPYSPPVESDEHSPKPQGGAADLLPPVAQAKDGGAVPADANRDYFLDPDLPDQKRGFTLAVFNQFCQLIDQLNGGGSAADNWREVVSICDMLKNILKKLPKNFGPGFHGPGYHLSSEQLLANSYIEFIKQNDWVDYLRPAMLLPNGFIYGKYVVYLEKRYKFDFKTGKRRYE